MKNFHSPGHSVTLTAPGGGVVSGQPYTIGSLVGIAAASADAGQPFVLHVTGVFEVPKTTGQDWAEGVPVYLTAGGVFTTSSGGNTLAGCAVAVAASASDVGLVRLNGSV